MHPVVRGLFGVGWTTAVTVAGVAVTRVTRNEAHALAAERLWARGLLRAWKVELEVEGADRLEPGASYVVMPNHRSYADIPVLFAALPLVPSFLAKQELSRVPVLGTALRAGRHVLVERGERGSSKQAIDAAAAQVAEGRLVVVFPEGTRSAGRELGDLKKGGFLIAKRAGAAIVPVLLEGTERILPVGGRVPRPGRVTVRVGRPIGADAVKARPARELVDEVRRALESLAGPTGAGLAGRFNGVGRADGFGGLGGAAGPGGEDVVADRISYVRVAGG